MPIAVGFQLSLGDIPMLLQAEHEVSAGFLGLEAFDRFQMAENQPPEITIEFAVVSVRGGVEPGGSGDDRLQKAELYLRSIFGKAWPSHDGRDLLLGNMLELVRRFLASEGFGVALDAVFKIPERFSLFVSPDLARAYAIVLDRHARQARVFLPEGWSLESQTHRSAVVSACLRYVLAMLLYQFSGLIVHAAAVQESDGCILFIGPSGSGKTTLVRRRPEAFAVLADDGVIVRREGDRFRAYTTPWNLLNGPWCREPRECGLSGEIEAVFLLGSDGAARLVDETPANAVGRSLQQMNPFLWWLDADGQQATWKLLSDMYLTVPAYRLDALAGNDTWGLIDEIISQTKRSEIDG